MDGRVVGFASVAVAWAVLVAMAATGRQGYPLALFGLLAGAAFLGSVVGGLLLGHWYLTDRGLSRGPIDRATTIMLVAIGLEAAAVIAGVYLVTAPVAVVLATLGGTISKVSPVINPVTLVEGLERWLYGRNTGVDIGGYGAVYLAVAVLLVIAYVALLLTRYRKVAA